MKMETPVAATPRKDRNNRRQLILECAARLFASQGYSATSMEELSDLTGLNKGTIYYYYKSKAAILFDMSFSIAGIALKRAAPATKMEFATDALTHTIDVIVDWIIANRNVVTTYFQESPYFESIFTDDQFNHIREQQLFLVKIFYQIIEKGIKTGEFRPVDIKATGRMIVGSIMWIYRWPEDKLDAEEISKAMLGAFFSGLKAIK